ncbi:putative Asparagine--Trna Ligase [Manis pentadactyla]|nr:putative Asparagine--Trna Ligase [Manis pentadactyla]
MQERAAPLLKIFFVLCIPPSTPEITLSGDLGAGVLQLEPVGKLLNTSSAFKRPPPFIQYQMPALMVYFHFGFAILSL